MVFSTYFTYLTYVDGGRTKSTLLSALLLLQGSTPSEVKAAKQAKRFSAPSGCEITVGNKDPERVEDQKGVMYYEYDLMFHYLLASLRRGLKPISLSQLVTRYARYGRFNRRHLFGLGPITHCQWCWALQTARRDRRGAHVPPRLPRDRWAQRGRRGRERSKHPPAPPLPTR
jgi:hypothetical protein